MKKILYLLVGVFMLLGVSRVSALSNTYVNANHVEMEYELYEKLSELYSKKYMEFVTKERYDELKETDFDAVEVVRYVDRPLIQPFASKVETEYKILKFIKNGTMVTLHLQWKKMPATRSYDVMGIRFNGVKLNGSIVVKQYDNINGSRFISSGNYSMFSNGFGVSFLLPNGNLNELEEHIEFRYSGSGTIYGTYQHAQRSLSLADSKKYSISSLGLGSVLKFASTTISDKYDKMNGVSINV